MVERGVNSKLEARSLDNENESGSDKCIDNDRYIKKGFQISDYRTMLLVNSLDSMGSLKE